MSGERDLEVLLRSMDPQPRHGEVVFVTAPRLLDGEVLATVVEPEGLSQVVPRSEADRLGLTYEFVGSWITLTVHSSLDAVGLTAAVSAALAGEGISCNVVAGHHHDHLVVPAGRADDAMAVLRALASR